MALLAGLVFGVVCGLTDAFSIFSIAFSQEFRASRASASGIFVLYLFVITLVAPLAGLSVDRLGPRRIIVSAFPLFAIGIALCAAAKALWELYACYGALIGVPAAFLMTSADVLVLNSYQDSRGKAIGIGYTCLGVGEFVLFSVLSEAIALVGWRAAYLLATAVAVISGSIFFLLTRSSSPVSVHSEEADAKADSGSRSSSAWRALALVALAIFFGELADYFAFQNTVPFLVGRGLGRSVAGLVLGFAALGYVIGHLVSGAMSDRSSREVTGTVSAMLYVVSLGALWSAAGDLWLDIISVMALGAGVGGFVGAGGAAVGDLFGGAGLGRVSGLIMAADTLGAAGGSSLGAIGFDVTGTYATGFLIAAGCLVVWVGAIWAAAPRRTRAATALAAARQAPMADPRDDRRLSLRDRSAPSQGALALAEITAGLALHSRVMRQRLGLAL